MTVDELIRFMNASGTLKFAFCLSEDSYDGFIMGVIRVDNHGDSILSITVASGNTEGRFGDISDLLGEVARANGCTSMEMKTRRGMMKVMRPEGWDESYVVITKDV